MSLYLCGVCGKNYGPMCRKCGCALLDEAPIERNRWGQLRWTPPAYFRKAGTMYCLRCRQFRVPVLSYH